MDTFIKWLFAAIAYSGIVLLIARLMSANRDSNNED